MTPNTPMNRIHAALVCLAAAATLSTAADIKFSDLPAASTLGGTEIMPGVQSSANKKISVAQINTFVAGSIAASNAYQPLASPLTSIAGVTNSAGLLKNDGSGNYSILAAADTGLLGDAGKVVLYGATGSVTANNFVRVYNGTAYAGLISNGFGGSKNSNSIFLLWPGTVTGSRTWTLPDKSGTVAMTSDITGTNSGTNTGDQTITLTGNVTGSGTGSFATTIAAGAVTDSMLAGSITPSKITGTAAILGANTFTGAQGISFTNQGTSPTTAYTIQSTTAATVGAQVEQSPYLVMAGAGWKTNATAASQQVAFWQNIVPIAGTSAPTGYWQLQSQVNGGTLFPVMTVTSDASSSGPIFTVGRVASFRFRAINRFELTVDNGSVYQWGVGSDFGNGACLARDWNLSWSNNVNVNAGVKNLVLGRDASFTAGVLQLGLNDPTTATHQTIRAHDVTTGAGANLILSGGTGSTTNGVVRIRGTTANDSATAGDVGEAVASTVASGAAVALTNNTAANVTSISLTAGDWDVVGVVSIAYTSATVTGSSAGFSTTTATVPSDGSEGYSSQQLTITSATDSIPVCMGRLSLGTTTTVYLTAKASFSAGSAGAFGKITARRRR